MTEAGEAAQQEPTTTVDPDWFRQIPFNPKTGLNSMLPIELPAAPPPGVSVAHDHGERG